ncbi:hypothetical protein [Providencia burhodogranariea]|uniref:Adhesin n=1 Tax=Providencia burhodogranariea DSM 19968 TaxID=1141662 RepID=K8W1K4_9GAMM|nr:hypothetical protein [Providencia burhodogranariea]EKT54418.1 hypothetical protein OOA_17336 [Providencia burhodogranariea DSM 19968]
MHKKTKMRWKLLLLSYCMLLPLISIGQISVDLDNFRNYILVKGPAQLSEFSSIGRQGNGWQTLNIKMNYGSWAGNGGYRDWNRVNCPSDVRIAGDRATEEEKQKFLQWVNSYLATNPRATANNPNMNVSIQTTVQVDVMVIGCYVAVDDYVFGGDVYVETVEIVNPPEPKSTCSLNSQNLNLNYSPTSLNVSGLTQSTNLIVSCTNGDAKDYQLKLTGSNVTNGRLNFGNGVSAQVSLNGTQVQANGSAISLNKLTGGSIPVSATLAGTASGPGVTNANGVLILDAL